MATIKSGTIIDITQIAYDTITSLGLSKKSLQQYWYCGVVPIRRYYEAQKWRKYTQKSAESCMQFFRKEYEEGRIYCAKFRSVRKIITIMEELQTGKSIVWRSLPHWSTTHLPEPFFSCLEQYIEVKREEGYKETTLRGLKPILKHFLVYVSSLGHHDLLSFTKVHAEQYITVLAESYKRVGACLSSLRTFGRYLTSKGLISVELEKLFGLKIPARKTVRVGFSVQEATQIISGIDRTTACGKRDYAILMLAMHTGLRGIDILQLTFSNISWGSHEIHLIQSKTERQLILPVSVCVLNAIADYILNARPKSEETSIIFLKVCKPHLPLKSWSAHSIVKRNAKSAGITWDASEYKGFHSFRRSLASWMLEAEIPLDTIKEILGHTSVNASKPYIAINVSGLANCALDITSIPLRREELK